MKSCQDIRGELSAYLDGELTSSRRAEVDAHLASCGRCQQELSEIRKLTAGVAALPRLQPAPRFLAEVRRKIAQDENSRPMTWQDYIFRPFWLKIPLEVAALIVVIGIIMRGEQPLPTHPIARRELTGASAGENNRPDTVSMEMATKTMAAGEPKASTLDRIAAGRPPAVAEESKKELAQAPQVPGNEEKNTATSEAHDLASTGDGGRPTGKSAIGEMAAVTEDQKAVRSRGLPMAQGTDALLDQPPAPSPMLSLIRSTELARSRPGETVTLRTRDFESVRSRAQQLATRCRGKVVLVPQSKGDTEQTLFVELPREYVAAFKLELLKTAAPTGPAKGGGLEQYDAMNKVTPSSSAAMGGVLTGTVATNNNVGGQGSLGLRDEEAVTPTVLMEIRVVAPAN